MEFNLFMVLAVVGVLLFGFILFKMGAYRAIVNVFKPQAKPQIAMQAKPMGGK